MWEIEPWVANYPTRLPMLKFINIARPFNPVRCIPLLLKNRVNTGVILRNRAYSSNPPRPRINTKQYNSKTKGPRTWLTKEEAAFLNSLLALIQERKFDDLFGSLNDSSSLTPLIFAKLIQPSWKIPLEMEIELKETVMKIMKDSGVKPTAFSITPMISLYAKVGDTSKADDLFKTMKEEGIKRNVTTYNSLMKCHENDTSKVDHLFARMIKDGIKPDVYTYSTMIKAFSKELDKVEKLFLEMIEKRIDPNVVIYNTMIDVYAKNGKLEQAIEIFASMKREGIKPTVITYNTMIDVYAKNGKLEQAIEVFASTKKDEVKFNVVTYATMIDAYAKNGKLEKSVEVFASMKRDGIKPDVYIYNTMIDAYAKNGQLEKSIELFASMKRDGIKPDVYTYNTMIDVYAKNGKLEQAIEVFVSMKRDGMNPDVVTYTTMIDVYAKNSQIDNAMEMFALMKRDGVKPNVNTFGALLDCYAKSGKHLNNMMYILKEMKGSSVVPNIRIWNNILEGFSRTDGEKDRKKALSIWKYLSGQQSYESLCITLPVKSLSIYPDAVTLSIALDVCKHGRFEKEADDVWKYGQDNDQVGLNSNVLTSYVECLASFGEKGADRAVELILLGIEGEKMPLRCVKPDKVTIRNAKSSLRSYGMKKHAAKLDGIEIKE
jgi:pentatricopeptide repeat protein